VILKQYGLPRSGTNHLKWMFEQNLEDVTVLTNKGGSKHGPYCIPYTGVHADLLVLSAKHPLSWVNSAWRWVRSKFEVPTLQLTDFIHHPLLLPEPDYRQRFTNPAEAWNTRNFEWLTVSHNGQKTVVVPYESMLQPESAERSLRCLAERFGVAVKDGCPHLPPERLIATGLPGDQEVDCAPRMNDQAFDPSFYTEMRYMEEYTQEDIEWLNDQFDWELAERMGYSKIETE
jgi:hypothetical protein